MPPYDYDLSARFVTTEEENEMNTALGVTPIIDLQNMKVKYGLYPKYNIDDQTLITALNAIPNPDFNGFYLYNNNYYAKIKATPNSGYGTFYFDNGVKITRTYVYWFKCEPITWRILSKNDNNYFLLSDFVIDNKIYDDARPKYAYSDMRQWLNDDFYNSAFGLNNEFIQTTEVDDSITTTNYMNTTTSYGTYDNYVFDKVFLPSYKDYTNSEYGFSETTEMADDRRCKTTDWARASGVECGEDEYYGTYCTRSRQSDYSLWFIGKSGSMSSALTSWEGVRPAIMINI